MFYSPERQPGGQLHIPHPVHISLRILSQRHKDGLVSQPLYILLGVRVDDLQQEKITEWVMGQGITTCVVWCA